MLSLVTDGVIGEATPLIQEDEDLLYLVSPGGRGILYSWLEFPHRVGDVSNLTLEEGREECSFKALMQRLPCNYLSTQADSIGVQRLAGNLLLQRDLWEPVFSFPF